MAALSSEASAAQVPKPPKVAAMVAIPATIHARELVGASMFAAESADGLACIVFSTI